MGISVAHPQSDIACFCAETSAIDISSKLNTFLKWISCTSCFRNRKMEGGANGKVRKQHYPLVWSQAAQAQAVSDDHLAIAVTAQI